jgi:hypothetical protein
MMASSCGIYSMAMVSFPPLIVLTRSDYTYIQTQYSTFNIVFLNYFYYQCEEDVLWYDTHANYDNNNNNNNNYYYYYYFYYFDALHKSSSLLYIKILSLSWLIYSSSNNYIIHISISITYLPSYLSNYLLTYI